MRLPRKGRPLPLRATDEELERRQRTAEEALRKAEARATDELMQLEWLRAQVRTWQGERPPDGDRG